MAWMTDGGTMGEVIRTTDWNNSSLGPVASWPLNLKNAINLCLASDLPIAIAWGPRCAQLYNDAFLPLCGTKHPASMGQDFRRCWAMAWPIIGDAFNRALAGQSQKFENKRMFLDRNGYLEETFFTCSFSPLRDDAGAVAGVFHPVVETTGPMLAQRRALLVRDIALRSAGANSIQQVLTLTAGVLSENELDIPFALFYLFDAWCTQAKLAASSGVPAGMAFSPVTIAHGTGAQTWPLIELASKPDSSFLLADIEQRFGAISCGPYPESPHAAMLVTIGAADSALPVGACVFGLSPRLPADETCRGLCVQIAASIAVAIANIRARDSRDRSVQTQARSQRIDVDSDAYQALVSSEQRQRCSLEAGEIGAWEFDFATKTVWRSPMHDQIFGYREPLTDWTEETFINHVVPEDRERVDREFRAAIKQTVPGHKTECRIYDANGEQRWVEIHSRTKFDARGKAERMFGTVTDVTEQLNLKHSLQRQTEILQMILNGMSEGVIVCNAERELILVNRSAEQLLKMEAEVFNIPELAQKYDWLQSDGCTPYPAENRPLLRALHGEKVAEFEATLRRIDQNLNIVVNCSSAPLRDEEGKIVGAVKVFRDVTASKIALQELRNAEQHFKLLVEGTTDYAIFMLDANGHIVSWNPGAQRILGYEEKEVIGRHVSIFYTPEDIAKGEPQRKLNQTVQDGRAEEDNWRVRKDGQRFWSTGVLDALHDENGGVRGFVEIMRDNTERRLAEENTYFLANHDPLTGLANRARFMERLHEALLNADRDDTQVAVLLLDLDRFKLINDTLGHHIGDLLLKKVSMRLSKCVRETDTVARLGGDEFVVILTRLKDVTSVETLAEKIIQEMSRPYHINRQEVRSGTSLGVAIYRRDGKDPGELLQKADLAMYRAKSSGRNHYRVFAPSMLTEMRIRSEQETSLRHALECQEFELSYQPQIDLNTLRLSGAEVLLRSRNRVLQGIPTSKVIALAEDTGLIIPLGEWILQTACRQMKKWQKMGLPEFKVAVNFSPTHLLAPNFIDTVQRILSETGLDAKYLEIEVTEGLLVAASEANNQVMTSLKELGVSISVDDFGTGYSALSYLKNFPVDVLKLDESLVRNLPKDQDDVAIVSAIIKLALDLNIKVIAEGVETIDQFAHLKTTDCKTAQGYLFSPAVKTDQFETLLHGRTWATPIFH
jgi:diguanylate cyclase (GGDEF)-like protein/PAS domain S-box-containing protein